MGIKEGYKKTEVGVIPEDWGISTLNAAVEFLDGQRRPVKSSDRAKMSGIYPYYGASGIVDYVNDYIFDEELILLGEDGENILSRNLPLAFRVKGKIWVNNHAHVMRVNSDFSIGYLTEFLESLDFKLLNSGTAQPKLNKQTCLRIKVAKPSETEQKTIAKALSDIDGLIEALDKLIAKKRAIKQAAMQQLLTGKTRLPGFDGEWEAVPLGKLAAIRNQKIMPAKVNDSFMCVELEHIGQGTGQLLKLSTASESASSKYRFFEGDVLFGRLRSYLRKYWYADQDGLCSTEIWPLITIPEELFSGYLHYLVQTEQFIEIASISYGTHMPRADWHVISNFKINLPRSITEQKAIATVLSDMDTEITALTQRRNKTKMIKQGMMQELLTGRTRLVTPKKEKKA
ncbi:MAG TPA: restriction endonuclease subunit S [Phycisphaerales bacterium]|nr:restriction endonuclease subunit S [Phycisphaerales bacterium]